ncbi:hypothetical protein AgCh_017156 [Apium graveolens]
MLGFIDKIMVDETLRSISKLPPLIVESVSAMMQSYGPGGIYGVQPKNYGILDKDKRQLASKGVDEIKRESRKKKKTEEKKRKRRQKKKWQTKTKEKVANVEKEDGRKKKTEEKVAKVEKEDRRKEKEERRQKKTEEKKKKTKEKVANVEKEDRRKEKGRDERKERKKKEYYVGKAYHEIVASEDYHKVMDFIRSCKLKYAMLESPVIYCEVVEEIWTTVLYNSSDKSITFTLKDTNVSSMLIFMGYAFDPTKLGDIEEKASG